MAQRSVSLDGLGEAEASDQIVTRFIDGLPARDPGADPHLGERPR